MSAGYYSLRVQGVALGKQAAYKQVQHDKWLFGGHSLQGQVTCLSDATAFFETVEPNRTVKEPMPIIAKKISAGRLTSILFLMLQ